MAFITPAWVLLIPPCVALQAKILFFFFYGVKAQGAPAFPGAPESSLINTGTNALEEDC